MTPNSSNRYVVLLRGINVTGHHKLPMAELRNELGKLGCKDITTLLASGNAVFTHEGITEKELEVQIGEHLESVFDFPVPAMVFPGQDFQEIGTSAPFSGIRLTPDIRCYASFLRSAPESLPSLPWHVEDSSFTLLSSKGRCLFSTVDLSTGKSTKGIDVLEKMFGKDMTTRNWNTVQKITCKI